MLNWKKAVFYLIFSLGSQNLFAKPLDVSIEAESAILINATTGAVLYKKNSQKQQFPASITKVATALYALSVKGDKLGELVSAEQEAIASLSEAAIKRSNYKLPSYYIEQGSSHIGIKKGEELKFSDLFYGMLLPSANDASNVIAQFVSGSIPLFVEEMNAYLKTIGCKNTHFCNPHGLHHPDHLTTAEDMALIAKKALENPFFCDVVKSVRFTRPKTNKQEASTLVQLNKLLKKGSYFYEKAIGIKTGHTSFALNTFVGAAREGERTLIAVVLKVKERGDIFEDTTKLFEAAFKEQKVEKVFVQKGKQKFILNHNSAEKPVETYAEKAFSITYYPAEEPEIKSFLKWDEVQFPIVKGQKVGELIIQNITLNKEKHIALYAEEDIKQSWGSWFKSCF
ncbi:MAG TPA: D-alanyl-D-alanine carboxypeptidase family protein [Parachlamydiaceae bacterium]|nr:D-alanyl-D-alanine carboxypeptidase family protein [Parachlamydiaceae bacterium]